MEVVGNSVQRKGFGVFLKIPKGFFLRWHEE
jgi:hypothetical protein